MKKKRIILTWGTIYSENLGVNALTYSALYILDKVAVKLQMDFEYILLGTQCQNEKYDKIYVGSKKIDFRFIPIKFIYYNNLHLFRDKYFRRLIRNADFIFDIGQGDSFTDIYGIKRSSFNLWSKIIFMLFGKRIILLPQTVGPFNFVLSKFVAKIILKKINLTFVRDILSSHFIKRAIPDKLFFESIDMAFVLPFNKQSKTIRKVKVGVNVSGLLWNGGYNRKNMFKLKDNYKSTMREIIETLIKLDVELHLIGHVFSGRSYIEDDQGANVELQTEFNSVILAPQFKNPIDAKSYINNMDFFIGSRMHSCIAAYSSGVPVVPIAYSRKFNGLFCESLNYKYLADATVHNKSEIHDIVFSAFNMRLQIKEEIRMKQSYIDRKLTELIAEISRYLIKDGKK